MEKIQLNRIKIPGEKIIEYSVSNTVAIIYAIISVIYTFICLIPFFYGFDFIDMTGFIIFWMLIAMIIPLMYYLYKSINEGKNLGSGKYIITSSGIYFRKGNKEIFIDFKDVKFIYTNEAKLTKAYMTIKGDGLFAFSNRGINLKLNNNEMILLSVPARLFGELINIFEGILKTHSNINFKHEKVKISKI